MTAPRPLPLEPGTAPTVGQETTASVDAHASRAGWHAQCRSASRAPVASKRGESSLFLDATEGEGPSAASKYFDDPSTGAIVAARRNGFDVARSSVGVACCEGMSLVANPSGSFLAVEGVMNHAPTEAAGAPSREDDRCAPRAARLPRRAVPSTSTRPRGACAPGDLA
jgi:hypothetical protein